MPKQSKKTGVESRVIAIRLEYVGVIAMACLAIGLIIGSARFGRFGPRDFIDIGNAAYDAEAPIAAIMAYEKALMIDPRNANVLTDTGTMYLKSGDADKAISYFEKAASEDPRHAKSRLNLGVALMSKKQYKEAADAFRECLSLSDDNDVTATAQAHLKIVEKEIKP